MLASFLSSVHSFPFSFSLSFPLSFLFLFLIIFHIGVILDLQESCRDSTEFLYALHLASSDVNCLLKHGAFVNTKKIILGQYVSLNYRLYLDQMKFHLPKLLVFPHEASLFVPRSTIAHYIHCVIVEYCFNFRWQLLLDSKNHASFWEYTEVIIIVLFLKRMYIFLFKSCNNLVLK